MKDEVDDLREWPGTERIDISDIVHGSIALHAPLKVLLDTPEFQRLRLLKQTGVCYLVYPSADHSRFSHSLGVYSLACEVVERLRRLDGSLGITSADSLCVSVAALCHDLGHGPFSHLFDGPLMRMFGKRYKHEEGSVLLLDRILAYPEVDAALRPFLGSSDSEFARNIQFIKEIIAMPANVLDSSGSWQLKGRPASKSFLYDIVNNVHDGCDVDKFDYLLRDSLATGVAIMFNANSMKRLLNSLRVLPSPVTGLLRICYAEKAAEEMMNVYKSRHHLHNVVYQHSTTRAIEELVLRALFLANDHLFLCNSEGRRFRLSEVTDDIDAFSRTDDSILRMIAYSNEPGLAESRFLLNSVVRRRLPRCLASAEFAPGDISRPNPLHAVFDIANEMRPLLAERVPQVKREAILVVGRSMYSGLDGCRHPISEALFFDSKAAHSVARKLAPEWLELRAPSNTAVLSLTLFVCRDSVEEQWHESLKEDFSSLLQSIGIAQKNSPK